MSEHELFLDERPAELEGLTIGELRALARALTSCRTCDDPECELPLHLVFGYALHSARFRVARCLQATAPEEYQATLADSRAASTAWLDQRRARLADMGFFDA